MIPVYQTKHGAEGNCFMACVASILEISLEECPDVYEITNGYAPGTNWMEAAREWLCVNHHVMLIGLAGTADGRIKPPQGYSIITGKTPAGTLHACVAHNGAVVHDPMELSHGILKAYDFMVLVPLCHRSIPCVPYHEQLRELEEAGKV